MRLLLIVLFIVSLQPINSQIIVNRISKSVGVLSYQDNTKPGSMSIGTGTLLIRFTTPKRDSLNVFLVTNRHVLPTFRQNAYVNFRIKNDSAKGGFSDVALELFEKSGKLGIHVKFDPDSNDLAVIDLTNYFIEHPEAQNILANVMPYELLATTEIIKNEQLFIGDEVFFIGFPSFLYDKRNISPVVRTGIISTSPDVDFYISDEYRRAFAQKFRELLPEKINGFLIDATAAGGSSGSLVISKPRYFRMTKNGQMEYYQDPNGQIFVLGILTESYLDLDARLSGVHRLNIGGVIASRQIIKTIDLFKQP